jgi:hypothetical protein
MLRFFPLAAVLILIVVDSFLAKPPLRPEQGVYTTEQGAVPAVEAYLKGKMEAGKSFEAVHWSKLVVSPAHMTMPSHRVGLVYKLVDADGTSRMYSKVFNLDNAGNIMFELDVEPFMNR